jgi:hypothetical protein
MAAVKIAMDGHYETWTAHFIRYVIRQISRRPDYHCRNLDAKLIDSVKRYEKLQHLI